MSCQVSNCSEKIEFSCICDYKINLCSLHYIIIHQKIPGIHEPIYILGNLDAYHLKVKEAHKKLEQAKVSIFNRGKLMMNTLGLLIKNNISKIIDKKLEINRISEVRYYSQENFELLEKVKLFSL